MIKVKNLVKNFDSKSIYHNVTFTMSNRTAVVGLNGSGKTTLMNIILGLDNDFSGKVEHNIKNASCVFSTNSLPEYLCINDLVKSRKLDANELDKYLLLFNIEKYKFTMIKNLSLGTKTKMNIVFCLLWDSDYLFFDEVTNSLDYQSIKKLKELLLEEKRNIFVISHDFLFLEGLVDQVIVIESDTKITEIEFSKLNEDQRLNEIIDNIIESEKDENIIS